jgi:hypothetical protein
MKKRLTRKELAIIAEHNNWAALRYNAMGQVASHPTDPKADNGWIVRDDADLRERLNRAGAGETAAQKTAYYNLPIGKFIAESDPSMEPAFYPAVTAPAAFAEHVAEVANEILDAVRVTEILADYEETIVGAVWAEITAGISK